jgi:hypothetical protein
VILLPLNIQSGPIHFDSPFKSSVCKLISIHCNDEFVKSNQIKSNQIKKFPNLDWCLDQLVYVGAGGEAAAQNAQVTEK